MKAVKTVATALIVVGLMMAGTQTASAAGSTTWICNAHALKVTGSSTSASATTSTTSTICGNSGVRATYTRDGQPGYDTGWKYAARTVTTSPGGIASAAHTMANPQAGYGGIKYT